MLADNIFNIAHGSSGGASSGNSSVGERNDIDGKVLDNAIENRKNTIISNKGNVYNNTPSINHSTTTKNPGLDGTPNSSVDILNRQGEVATRRWFGPNGKAVRDIDMTNHGNLKLHPELPHEHNYQYNPDGSLKVR